MGVVQALGLSPETRPASACAWEGGRLFHMWHVVPNVQQSSAREEAPQSLLLAARSRPAPPPKGLLIFVPLSWTFLPDSGLAAHPGQTDRAPVPASGHHNAAHHGERAPSAGREAPTPAPVGAAPAVLGDSRYPLVSAEPQLAEESGFSSRWSFVFPSEFSQGLVAGLLGVQAQLCQL